MTDTMVKVAMFLGDNGEAELSRELFAENEQNIAKARAVTLVACIDSIKLESTLDPDANAVYEQGYQAACSNILHAISKLQPAETG
ncbi:hypothetical protein LCGC14_2435040 [marine sediment metagenome]|uniref:Uncharacterized protein n=1 Tax=marine sediment metagenome TaxID=412755 RepID=A0A0F9EEQ0_9ZZZZ